MNATVLVAEDEPNIRSAIVEYLRAAGWQVLEAEDGLEAREIMISAPVDILLSDIRMPQLDGHGLLKWVQDAGPSVPVVFISGHGDVAEAVSALQNGAADYILKPFELPELSARISRCLREGEYQRAQRVQPQVWDPAWHRPSSGPLCEAFELAEKAAPTDATVLISGESGTGKEVMARFIHNSSLRRGGPFVAINAGAIPEGLLESELFGHEKGAFSGSSQRRIGYFEAAHHGTLFLDEIGELPLQLQVKLLRVIQDRQIQRLGSSAAIPLDTRILAATNRDLSAMVADGTFRRDLYYRIQVIEVKLPPLRQRKVDLQELVDTILPRIAARLRVLKLPPLGAAAVAALAAYDFPGNVRELENMLERALILARDADVLEPGDLGLPEPSASARAAVPAPGRATDEPHQDPPQGFRLSDWEDYLIGRALARCGGNRTRAAELLGIGRRTLQEKIARRP